MCIEQVMSHRYNGKLYPAELDAVKAALTEIGVKLIKDHSNDPMKGLLELGEHVSHLRARYIALSPPPIPTDEAPPKDAGEPEEGGPDGTA
jgi:hypothetical protein